MKRALIIVAALAAGLVGCASGGGASGGDAASGVTVLQAGSHSGVKDTEQQDIHDQAAFQAAWDKIYSDQSSKPSLPSVDFTKQTVIYYSVGEMKHGGYSVKVTHAEPSGTGYVVGITVIQPGMDCHNMTMDITHPFLFAAVPTTGPVTFDQVKKRELPPCS